MVRDHHRVDRLRAVGTRTLACGAAAFVGLVALPVAALGWIIEHFLATYAGPDPVVTEPRRAVSGRPPDPV